MEKQWLIQTIREQIIMLTSGYDFTSNIKRLSQVSKIGSVLVEHFACATFCQTWKINQFSPKIKIWKC
jgi:hypothetical protein